MGLKSTRDTLVRKIEEVANTSTDLEQLSYAGASLQKLVDIDFDILPEDTAYNIGVAGTMGFGVAAIKDELLPSGYTKLTGHTDVAHPNYGAVMDVNGSVFYYIPPHYKKMVGNEIHISVVALSGYVKSRAFYDSPFGFLFSAYLMGNIGGKLVSKQFSDPVSVNSLHNPIGSLNSAPSNTYGGFIDACKSSGYKTPTLFEWTVIQDLALAQSQSGASSALCAYNDVAPFFPKGNNDNALRDTDDTSLTFTASGYSNCALTGSASNKAKTTHNGQNCGIADVNGNMFKIVTGLTFLAKTGATCANGGTSISMPSHGLAVGDVIYFGEAPTSGSTYNTGAYTVAAVADGNNFTVGTALSREIVASDGVYSPRYFRILKASVNANTLTSENILDDSLYDLLDLTGVVDSNIGSVYFGNGANQVLHFSTDTNSKEYDMANCGIPASSGVSAVGTTSFGNDYIYKFLRHGLVPLVGGNWTSTANAGVFRLGLSGYSANSSDAVGGFASVSL